MPFTCVEVIEFDAVRGKLTNNRVVVAMGRFAVPIHTRSVDRTIKSSVAMMNSFVGFRRQARVIGWVAFLVALSTSHGMTVSRKGPSNLQNGTQQSQAIKERRTSNKDSRRGFLQSAGLALATFSTATRSRPVNAIDVATEAQSLPKRTYFQRFPTLFDPLYGEATRTTIKYNLGTNIWGLEQNLQLGPLETPLRCVVVRLQDGSLWVHAPLAPTEEFFDLVESCSSDRSSAVISHVVVPTYALEHKVFVKDALKRWPTAQLWTAPGQFSFPIRSIGDEFVFGKQVTGVFDESDRTGDNVPSWTNEIEYETLTSGTYSIGGSPTTFYETAFFHKASKSLIVTDAVAQIPLQVPPLNDPQKLLLVSKRSTLDPQPMDTAQGRQDGWEKTALLVSYFFPEHEELDPEAGFGVVTWTDGWHENFRALAGRLVVPPVVRTLIYEQSPSGLVQGWVDRVVDRWEFEQILPAHFEAPIRAGPKDLKAAFAFLKDKRIDPFPAKDLERGLKPIADIASTVL